jgi:hypothetical protein
MDNPDRLPARISMMEVWYHHHFRADTLAKEAGVSDEVVYALLRHKPVKRLEAQKVLDTLSRLYQQEYTLSTVSVPLIEEKPD